MWGRLNVAVQDDEIYYYTIAFWLEDEQRLAQA